MIESIQITRMMVCDSSDRNDITKISPQMVQPRRAEKKRKEKGKGEGGGWIYRSLACERNLRVGGRDGGARS